MDLLNFENRRPLKILVVDDSADDRKRIARLLQVTDLSIAVTDFASSCAEGIQKLRARAYDVALVDYSLADGTGEQVVDALKSDSPVTASIIITGNEDDRLGQVVIRRGAQDYLSKSQVDGTNLERAILYSIERNNLMAELAQRELQLKMANDKLERASVAKTNFLSYVSHEVRTPLTLVSGIADLLAKTDLDSRQSKFVRTFQKASSHILEIVNDVLDINKIETGGFVPIMSPFSLKKFMDEIGEISESACQLKNLDFSCTVETQGVDSISLDIRALRQVLLNIINNAIKFTDIGGVHLSVTMKAPEREGGKNLFVFQVRDTGPGIAAGEMEKLFHRFSQTKVRSLGGARGSGLGLYLAQDLARQLGGGIRVQSNLGEGSVFSVEIEADCFLPNGASGAVGSVRSSLTLNTPAFRVLFAEDDIEIRHLIGEYLVDSHLKIDFAEDGIKALQMIQSNTYDLVFLDLDMPGASGDMVLKRTRAWEKRGSLPATPIFAFTGQSFSSEVEKAQARGFNGFVPKPISKKGLFFVLESFSAVLDKGQFFESTPENVALI